MIRPFVGTEADTIIEIWRSASELAHPFLSAEFMTFAETAIRDTYLPKAETYVCEHDGEVAGFIALLGNHIGGLFLTPKHHRKGLGGALVDHALQLKGSLTVDVFEQNAIGRQFYDAYGFQKTGEFLDEDTQQITIKMTITS